MNFRDLDVQGKRVVVRVDFNVPLNDAYEITDNTRIINAVPTLKHLLDNGSRVILLSHLGRPQKNKLPNGDIDVHRFTLQHLVKPLSDILGVRVKFAPSCCNQDTINQTHTLADGEVLLCENTRFEAGETKGDEDLAEQMAQLGDIYINDAFGTAHRAHASTAVISKFFPAESKSFGLLMEREIENAEKVLGNPNPPVVAILGGAKVSDKIELVKNLIPKADAICIGGGMAYTFFKAKGGQVGQSLVEDDKLDLALEILALAQDQNCTIHLPMDSVCAQKFEADADAKVMPSDQIEQGWMGLDIGPQAREEFSKVIAQAKTILWNGPMGVFEFKNFAEGTFTIANAVADATQGGAFSLIGGGDSVSAINKSGLSDQVSFISTGGGAMLEYLEGKILPGIASIKE